MIFPCVEVDESGTRCGTVVLRAPCFIFGALRPCKSGLMSVPVHIHIVKHICGEPFV